MERTAQLSPYEVRHPGQPDETRNFEKGKIEMFHMEGGSIGRATLQPGWKWSLHLKPIAKTNLCEAQHFQYHLSGKLRVRMADGKEFDLGPGDISCLRDPHDAWVVGNEPVVVIDWQGMKTYAEKK